VVVVVVVGGAEEEEDGLVSLWKTLCLNFPVHGSLANQGFFHNYKCVLLTFPRDEDVAGVVDGITSIKFFCDIY
jgi:hypothetical protein